MYAEEVAAARLRRESQRIGGVPGAIGGMLSASASTTSLKEHERNKQDTRRLSRPVYDQHSRRQASEPGGSPSTPSGSPRGSPGTSRPPSIAGPSGAGHGGRGTSRPASVYSTHTQSSEDVRANAKASKRMSVSSSTSLRPHSDRPSFHPSRSSSNMSLVPPVPPVPQFAMDMPLLPPTAPFMMNQYPRPRSRNSVSPGPSSPSSSPSRPRVPSNHSSEHVNSQHVQQTYPQSAPPHRPDYRHSSSAPSPVTSSPTSSSSAPSPTQRTHRRNPSDDTSPRWDNVSRGRPRAEAEAQFQTPRSPQPSSISRGRPPQGFASAPSSYLQIQNPWQMPGVQLGMVPGNRYSGMPGPRPAPPVRSQTAIS